MSITRRAFLQGAILGACALPCWTLSELARPDHLKVDHVIFDARRYHALAFAETARRLGANTCAFSSDAAQRECRDLFVRSKTEKTALAGLTDFPSLFLLQAMAADVGMYPVLRIHHRTRQDMDTHEVFGVQLYRAICDARFARRGASWAAAAAHLVLNLPAHEFNAVPAADNLREADLRVLASKAMVTWVMA
jgi:hypothetical protein